MRNEREGNEEAFISFLGDVEVVDMRAKKCVDDGDRYGAENKVESDARCLYTDNTSDHHETRRIISG